MAMKLRAYKDQDIDKLLQLWWVSWHSSSSFKHPRPIEDWKRRWESLLVSHQVSIIEEAGTIVGFAAVEPVNRELSQIFVSPEHKSKGYGKALFAWACEICGDSMKLKTLAQNTQARAFYSSRGMKETGYSVNDFNGKKEVVFTFL